LLPSSRRHGLPAMPAQAQAMPVGMLVSAREELLHVRRAVERIDALGRLGVAAQRAAANLFGHLT
jgi:hypothetical protein